MKATMAFRRIKKPAAPMLNKIADRTM